MREQPERRPSAWSRSVRNGVPLLRSKPKGRQPTLELVNRLRDEGAADPAWANMAWEQEGVMAALTETSDTLLQEGIREMVRRIVRGFDPEAIILFGSHARGSARPDSDVDLLVVMPVEGSKRQKQLEIRLALHGVGVAKDILVTTPEDFAWRKEVPGTVERPAAREGKILYARPRPRA